MRIQPTVGAGSAFTPQEWDLLVRLPGQIVVAATSAEPDGPRKTVAEGLAGIDAIAAGLESTNLLIRSVVAAIYAEYDEEAPVPEEFEDRAAGLAAVVALCREVSGVLGRRCRPEDRAAYQAWMTSIANRVCAASSSGGLFGLGRTEISRSEQAFLTSMSAVFES